MIFPAQRETLELLFQLDLTANRLSHLERCANLDLGMAAERGILPEDIECKVTFLDLLDGELAHAEREIKRCRDLIQGVFNTLGYGSPLLPYHDFDNQQH